MTPYYNLPHISWEANDPTFGQKDIFKTFVRLSATFNKVGLATSALFSQFRWNVTALLIQTSYGGYPLKLMTSKKHSLQSLKCYMHHLRYKGRQQNIFQIIVGYFLSCFVDVCLHAMNGFLSKVVDNKITVTSYQRFTEIPNVLEIDDYLINIKKSARSRNI